MLQSYTLENEKQENQKRAMQPIYTRKRNIGEPVLNSFAGQKSLTKRKGFLPKTPSKLRYTKENEKLTLTNSRLQNRLSYWMICYHRRPESTVKQLKEKSELLSSPFQMKKARQGWFLFVFLPRMLGFYQGKFSESLP